MNFFYDKGFIDWELLWQQFFSVFSFGVEHETILRSDLSLVHKDLNQNHFVLNWIISGRYGLPKLPFWADSIWCSPYNLNKIEITCEWIHSSSFIMLFYIASGIVKSYLLGNVGIFDCCIDHLSMGY